nr:hypothetical protein [Kofleriaceae bacterium]
MSVVVTRALAIGVFAMLVATSAAADPDPKPKPKADDDGEPKLSLPTESDRVAWTSGGFRLGLGIAYGDMAGLRGAPSGRLLGARMHAGLRLDHDWSLMTTFEYASASRHLGLSGLRFLGTVDPTWHVTRALSVAVGFGFGGIVEGKGTGRPDVSPFPGELDQSYTFSSSEHPLPSCSGVGEAAVARVDYAWVIGPRSQTHVSVEALGQYTKCVDPTGRVEPDTAQPIVRIQYWAHSGVELEWGVTWR